MTAPAPPGLPAWLPRALSQQVSPLQLVGYARAIQDSEEADDDGQAVARFGALEHDTAWLIDYILVQAPTGNPCTAFVYEGEPANSGFGGIMAATNEGRFDINELNQPLYLPPGAELFVGWNGVAPGTVCTCRVQYRVIRTGG